MNIFGVPFSLTNVFLSIYSQITLSIFLTGRQGCTSHFLGTRLLLLPSSCTARGVACVEERHWWQCAWCCCSCRTPPPLSPLPTAVVSISPSAVDQCVIMERTESHQAHSSRGAPRHSTHGAAMSNAPPPGTDPTPGKTRLIPNNVRLSHADKISSVVHLTARLSKKLPSIQTKRETRRSDAPRSGFQKAHGHLKSSDKKNKLKIVRLIVTLTKHFINNRITQHGGSGVGCGVVSSLTNPNSRRNTVTVSERCS